MEKLLEFDKKIFGEQSKYYRFQCDCLDASEAMDIAVEAWGADDTKKHITLFMTFYGTGLWDRVKYAFAILRGHWSWREFIVREEDYKDASEIFDPIKKYSELP